MKTFITSIPLAMGMMVCAQGATTVYNVTTANAAQTAQGSLSSNASNAYVRGFKLSLASDWFFPVVEGGDSSKALLPAEVKLDSFSISLRTAGMFNLIVLSGNATAAGQSEVVGFSSMKSSSNGIGTWSFDNLILDSSTVYTFIFTNIADASAWTTTSTVGNTGEQQGVKVGTQGTTTPSAYPAGEGLYTNTGGFNTSFVSTITMEVSSLPIPEPTTATLGLLGLSALMLRRSKK